MVAPSEEMETKVVTEGAQNFIDHYYAALNERKSLTPFYATSNPKYAAAGTAVDISINGAVCALPTDYEALLEAQAPASGGVAGRVRFEVESFDVHVLNAAFRVACPEALRGEARGRGRAVDVARKCSLLLHVGGWAQYGPGKEAARGGFAENFVLVPNWDSMGPRAPRGVRSWLIMSQNFRAL